MTRTGSKGCDMTDRELLELAAKAAGLFVAEDIDGSLTEYFCEEPYASAFEWNPLQDDGDAMRLAVKLQIDIDFPNDHVVFADGNWSEPLGQDRPAATRRAIVRAAAALVEGMP